MTRLYIFTLLLLMSGMSLAQNKDITTRADQEGNSLVFRAKNNTKHPQEITITLTKYKGLRDGKIARSKIVAPGEEAVIKKVMIAQQSYSYSYNSSWKKPDAYAAKKEKEHAALLKTKEQAQLAAFGNSYDLDNGIVVFTKEDCPRCYRATSFLMDNDIEFTLISTADNPENKKLMWKVLRENGAKSGSIVTPVVIVNGKVSYSHEDLRSFLEGLK